MKIEECPACNKKILLARSCRQNGRIKETDRVSWAGLEREQTTMKTDNALKQRDSGELPSIAERAKRGHDQSVYGYGRRSAAKWAII